MCGGKINLLKLHIDAPNGCGSSKKKLEDLKVLNTVLKEGLPLQSRKYLLSFATGLSPK